MSAVPQWLSLSKFLAAIVFLGLMSGVYLAGRWLLADLSEMNASAHLDSWRELGTVTSVDDWQDAHDSLQRAIVLKPEDAFLYQQLGVIYEFKNLASVDVSFTPLERVESRYHAVDAYRKSAELRPAWPDGWAHLARMKAYILQIDEEFFQAFNNALLLGATEVRVDRELRPLCPLISFFDVPESLNDFCSIDTEQTQ
jgi:hypothetical protein